MYILHLRPYVRTKLIIKPHSYIQYKPKTIEKRPICAVLFCIFHVTVEENLRVFDLMHIT